MVLLSRTSKTASISGLWKPRYRPPRELTYAYLAVNCISAFLSDNPIFRTSIVEKRPRTRYSPNFISKLARVLAVDGGPKPFPVWRVPTSSNDISRTGPPTTQCDHSYDSHGRPLQPRGQHRPRRAPQKKLAFANFAPNALDAWDRDQTTPASTTSPKSPLGSRLR